MTLLLGLLDAGLPEQLLGQSPDEALANLVRLRVPTPHPDYDFDLVLRLNEDYRLEFLLRSGCAPAVLDILPFATDLETQLPGAARSLFSHFDRASLFLPLWTPQATSWHIEERVWGGSWEDYLEDNVKCELAHDRGCEAEAISTVDAAAAAAEYALTPAEVAARLPTFLTEGELVSLKTLRTTASQHQLPFLGELVGLVERLETTTNSCPANDLFDLIEEGDSAYALVLGISPDHDDLVCEMYDETVHASMELGDAYFYGAPVPTPATLVSLLSALDANLRALNSFYRALMHYQTLKEAPCHESLANSARTLISP